MAEAVGVIRLSGGFMDGQARGWRSAWPPPELLVAARSKAGMTAIANPDEEFQELLPELREHAWLVRYVRARCSYDQPLIAHYGYDGIY